jgi:hypothetical protein
MFPQTRKDTEGGFIGRLWTKEATALDFATAATARRRRAMNGIYVGQHLKPHKLTFQSYVAMLMVIWHMSIIWNYSTLLTLDDNEPPGI